MPNCSYRLRVSGASFLVSGFNLLPTAGYQCCPKSLWQRFLAEKGDVFDLIIVIVGGIEALPLQLSNNNSFCFRAKDIKQKRRSLLICINIRLTFIPKNVFAVLFFFFSLTAYRFSLPSRLLAQEVVIIFERFWPSPTILVRALFQRFAGQFHFGCAIPKPFKTKITAFDNKQQHLQEIRLAIISNNHHSSQKSMLILAGNEEKCAQRFQFTLRYPTIKGA